jgi:hypothetical protein
MELESNADRNRAIQQIFTVGRAAYCRVCLDEHDDEIHAATISVRERLREEVTRYLDYEVPLAS